MSEINERNKKIIEEFRANGGKVGGAFEGGAPTHPDWYYNVVANPLVSVEVGMEKFQARATVAQEPERTRLYEEMVKVMPGFDDYRKKTARVIPVIVLTRV